MYLVIGLNKDSKLSLADACTEQPDLGHLTQLVRDFEYTQLLIVSSGGCQIGRFEATLVSLKQVELA